MRNDQWIFLDWGGVVGRFDPDAHFSKMANLFSVTPYEIISFIFEGISLSRWVGFETTPEPAAVHYPFCKRFGKEIGFDEFCRAFNFGIYVPDSYYFQEFMSRMRRAGLNLGLVSNINPIHKNFVTTHFPSSLAMIPLAFRFFSCDLGKRKDGAGLIFQEVFSRCGIEDPQKAVLVDDREINVKGMRAAGGKGIVFSGFLAAEYELIQLGFLPKS